MPRRLLLGWAPWVYGWETQRAAWGPRFVARLAQKVAARTDQRPSPYKTAARIPDLIWEPMGKTTEGTTQVAYLYCLDNFCVVMAQCGL